MVLRPRPGLLAEYLYYFLDQAQFREAGAKAMVGAVGHKRIPPEFVEALEIPLPPLDEQRRLVGMLDKAFAAIASAIANAQKNQANARALFESYLQSALTQRDETWAEWRFDEVCEISSKLVDPRLSAYFDLPHIGAGNMESKTGEVVDVKTAREEGLISGKFLFDPSMVLYSKIRPYLMKACRPDFQGLCSADVYPLAPKAGVLDRDLLFNILMSEGFTAYAEAGSARAGMPKVNRDHLFKYAVWLPPIAEQREIARRLDGLAVKCRALASSYQQQLEALSELKQSLLLKAFAGELTAKVTDTATPAANDNFATPQRTAQVIAFAHRLHEKKGKQQTFGRVKAQKSLHLIESVGGVELGRQPMRDAAGPNDFAHMLRAEEWAEAQGFFKFQKRTDGGYDFIKLAKYDTLWADAETATQPVAAELTKAVGLIVDTDSEFAELIATTHAAWNNLIRDQVDINDDAIVLAARDNWHVSKLRFDQSRFHDAIRFIRTNGIVPNGCAKYVGGQVSLF